MTSRQAGVTAVAGSCSASRARTASRGGSSVVASAVGAVVLRECRAVGGVVASAVGAAACAESGAIVTVRVSAPSGGALSNSGTSSPARGNGSAGRGLVRRPHDLIGEVGDMRRCNSRRHLLPLGGGPRERAALHDVGHARQVTRFPAGYLDQSVV